MEGKHTGHPLRGEASLPSDMAQRIHTELGNQAGFYKQMEYASEEVVPSTLCKPNGNTKMKNTELKGLLKSMN